MSPGRRARIAGLFYLLIFIATPSGAANATPLKMVMLLALINAPYFILEPKSDSQLIFRQGEAFSGLLVPAFRRAQACPGKKASSNTAPIASGAT
jgi:hypothetical protein